LLVVVLIVSALAGVAVSSAAEQRLFPLAAGNRWVLKDEKSPHRTTMSIAESASGLVLRGLPLARGELRVRDTGRSVQVWDTADRRWEVLFDFGAPAGSMYVVDLAATEWRRVRATVASRSVSARDYQGEIHRRCTRITFRFRLADAGVEEMVFAPETGPVRITETWIGGLWKQLLSSHRLRA
jgi:hypothetical protein